MSTQPLPTPPKTPWVRALALSVALTAVLSLLVVAFAWPATQLAPRDLPVVITGPAGAATQAQAALDRAVPGGFAVTVEPDEAAARAAVARRDAYGAIVLGNPPTVLTASAASPVVAQVLTQLGSALAAQQASATPLAVRVVDVVPAPSADPRGAGFASLALPMVIGAMAVGVASARAVSGRARQLVTVLLAATGAGLALAGIAHGWLGILTGPWWADAAVLAFGIAAVGFTLVGLEAATGLVGLALGGAMVMLLGNPLSGLTSAPEMLPTGWGTLGQWLPPGAAGTLLRSVSFFADASVSPGAWILAAWMALGLVLTWVGSRRHPLLARHEGGMTQEAAELVVR